MGIILKHDILSDQMPKKLPFDENNCRKIARMSGLTSENVRVLLLSGRTVSTLSKRFYMG